MTKISQEAREAEVTSSEGLPVGKNFSGNNLGQRRAGDFYETPYSMAEQLLDAHEFDLSAATLEPACGAGAISRVLRSRGFTSVTEYDAETDFLREQGSYSQIISNPPFSQALAFVKKAKEVAEKRFAFLLPLSYLHGKQRLDEVYTDREFPLAAVYVFCRYPMLGDPLREDGCYRTGMMVYAWFVWDRDWSGEPVIRWIDNQRFILSNRQTRIAAPETPHD